MAALLEWAGLTNTKERAAQGQVQALVGARTALLAFIGAEPNSHYRAIAALTGPDFVSMRPPGK